MVNYGDGIDDFGNPNHYRDEIKELSKKVLILVEKMQHLQLPTKGTNCIRFKNFFGTPHWHRAKV